MTSKAYIDLADGHVAFDSLSYVTTSPLSLLSRYSAARQPSNSSPSPSRDAPHTSSAVDVQPRSRIELLATWYSWFRLVHHTLMHSSPERILLLFFRFSQFAHQRLQQIPGPHKTSSVGEVSLQLPHLADLALKSSRESALAPTLSISQVNEALLTLRRSIRDKYARHCEQLLQQHGRMVVQSSRLDDLVNRPVSVPHQLFVVRNGVLHIGPRHLYCFLLAHLVQAPQTLAMLHRKSDLSKDHLLNFHALWPSFLIVNRKRIVSLLCGETKHLFESSEYIAYGEFIAKLDVVSDSFECLRDVMMVLSRVVSLPSVVLDAFHYVWSKHQKSVSDEHSKTALLRTHLIQLVAANNMRKTQR
jgi:hypothetical protein